jgi:hypothetical protein
MTQDGSPALPKPALLPRYPSMDVDLEQAREHRSLASQENVRHLDQHQPSYLHNSGAASSLRQRLEGASEQQGPLRPSSTTVPDETSAPVESISEVHPLSKALSPILDSAPCLLLCSGNAGRCIVYPVHMGEDFGGTNVWQKIRTTWYDNKEHWRRYLPGYRVRSVEIVKVNHIICIMAPQEGGTTSTYLSLQY